MRKIAFFGVLLCASVFNIYTATAKKPEPAEGETQEKERLVEVEEVVVTSSRNQTKRREAASIVGVLPTKIFERTASNSAAEVLNFQPGLRVEYNCANCGVPQLRINGLEGQYSQILLDSRPIFSSLAAVYGIEQMPASMIERIEVIRGGGSALFGSSAIGGVVNIITREPIRSTLNLSNTTGFYEGGGTDVNTSLNGALVSADNRAGVYLFSMIRDRSAYDRDGDGFSESPTLKSTTVGMRGFYKLSPSSRLTAEYHHIDEFRRGGDQRDRPPHEATLAEQLRHNINGGGLRYDFTSADLRHRLNVYISGQTIDRDSYFGTHQMLDAYGTTFDATIVGGVQYTYEMKKCLFMPAFLTAGIEYTNNYLKDQFLGYNRVIDQLSECYGAFVQNEWRNDKLSLLIGGRLDKHNKVKDVIFSPRVNIRYNPIKQIGIRASYSSGYRAPQAYDEDLHVSAVGGEPSIIVIDPNLRPEYSNSVSASLDLQHRWGSWGASLLIEGFYTDLRDVFVLREQGTNEEGHLIMERTNASGATIGGVNVEARVDYLSRLSFDLGFTYQKSFYKEPFKWSESLLLTPQRQMFRSPDAYGYFAVNYNPLRDMTITANATYTGPMLVQHRYANPIQDREVITPDFWDVGLRIAYDISLHAKSGIRLQLSLGVKNILDQYQRDIDQGADRDSKYVYGPAFPRMYYFGAKFTI